jgi:hypothetical protein
MIRARTKTHRTPRPRLLPHLLSEALRELSGEISQECRRLDVLIERNERALGAAMNRPERPPFVCCLLEGHSDHGATSLAEAGEVTNGSRTFDLRPNFRIFGGRLIVFCDVSRVRVRIFRGVDLLHANLDGAPIAHIPLVEVGVIVRIQCEVIHEGEA